MIDPAIDADIQKMMLLVYLGVALGAVAVGIAAWLLGILGMRLVEAYRTRFLSEAEFELQDMFLMMPAAQYLNYSVIAAALSASLVFSVIVTAGSGWNFKIATFMGLLAFTAVIGLSRFLLRFLRKRRLERFNDQLEEALMSMSNSLKAGFSIMQSIEMIVRQNRNPISIEFKLMVQQVQLGMTIDEALKNMASRVNSEDFFLVMSAITTARQTGGDLTGIFDRLATLIRERLRIQRRISSLTAMGRLQGLVLSLVPVVLFFVLWSLDPSLVVGFFTQPMGIVAFTLVLGLMTAGYFVIRKIVDIDI